jgi:hypothetical protein
MSRRRIFGALGTPHTRAWVTLGCSVLAVAACARATPEVPSTVAASVAAIAAECTRVGGVPLTSDAVQTADLNSDGHSDFVLYNGWIECDGAASVYGDREKGVLVFIGDGKGGASEAFNDLTYGATIETEGSGARLWLTTSAEMCGKEPAPDFASEHFCDRAIAWDASTMRFDYAPVSTVRLFE